MLQTRTLLLILLAVLALLGAGFMVLASIGDASVIASTAGVHGALVNAGVQDHVSLRDDLYAVVLRLKGPWAVVQLGGLLVFFLSLVALMTVWRRLK